METLAIALAGLFQILGFAVFFAQPQDTCSPAPTAASWIFLAATLCFLWDTDIYPCRFMHMAHIWQLAIESVATVFMVELSAIIIWCGIERFLYSLLEVLFNVTDSQRCVPFALISWLKRLVSGSPYCKPSTPFYLLSGLITSAVSLAALCYIVQATDALYHLRRMYCEFFWNVRTTWRMMRCYFAMNIAGRRRTLHVCQMANKRNRSNRRQTSRNCCPKQEEEYDDDDVDDCDSD